MGKENILANVFFSVLLLVFIGWLTILMGHEKNNKQKPVLITALNGRFQPAYIQVKQGQPVKLNFLRLDRGNCFNQVFFPEIHLAYRLPVGQSVEIHLPALKRGAFQFNCGQGTSRGVIVVT